MLLKVNLAKTKKKTKTTTKTRVSQRQKEPQIQNEINRNRALLSKLLHTIVKCLQMSILQIVQVKKKRITLSNFKIPIIKIFKLKMVFQNLEASSVNHILRSQQTKIQIQVNYLTK